jgi:hypothetical protein
MSKSLIIINHERDDKNHHIPNSMLSYVLEPCDLEKNFGLIQGHIILLIQKSYNEI